MEQGSLARVAREKRPLRSRRWLGLLAMQAAAIAVACDSFSDPVGTCGGQSDCGATATPPSGPLFPPKGGGPGLSISGSTAGGAAGTLTTGGTTTAGGIATGGIATGGIA